MTHRRYLKYQLLSTVSVACMLLGTGWASVVALHEDLRPLPETAPTTGSEAPSEGHFLGLTLEELQEILIHISTGWEIDEIDPTKVGYDEVERNASDTFETPPEIDESDPTKFDLIRQLKDDWQRRRTRKNAGLEGIVPFEEREVISVVELGGRHSDMLTYLEKIQMIDPIAGGMLDALIAEGRLVVGPKYKGVRKGGHTTSDGVVAVFTSEIQNGPDGNPLRDADGKFVIMPVEKWSVISALVHEAYHVLHGQVGGPGGFRSSNPGSTPRFPDAGGAIEPWSRARAGYFLHQRVYLRTWRTITAMAPCYPASCRIPFSRRRDQLAVLAQLFHGAAEVEGRYTGAGAFPAPGGPTTEPDVSQRSEDLLADAEGANAGAAFDTGGSTGEGEADPYPAPPPLFN